MFLSLTPINIKKNQRSLEGVPNEFQFSKECEKEYEISKVCEYDFEISKRCEK